MAKITLPIAGGFYQSPSLAISNQRCVNLYPNIAQTQTPYAETLLGTAGLSLLATTGQIKQVNRGAWVKSGVPYFVNGEALYRLDRSIIDGVESFSVVELGSITGEGRCLFADNGKQLLILNDSGDGWIYDETAVTPFQQITDADFTTTSGKPVSVVFIDSFFVVSTDEKKIKKSAANDGLTWPPLDFSGAEADPDDIVGLNVFRNQLYALGSETIEVFENAGLGGFPFQRVRGFVVPKGLSSKYAVVNTSDAMMWLGAGEREAPAIWLLSGSSPQKVSTTAIDSEISKFTAEEIQSCFAWSYAEAGAYFVGFTFPNATFVYDIITQRWHERESQVINNAGLTESARWRCNSVVQAYGRIIGADSQDGRLGELSTKFYTEYEQPLLSFFTTLPLRNEGKAVSITSCELVLESGVGSLTEAARVRMQTSQDGRVFKDSLTRKFGKTGEYDARAIWNKMGRFAKTAVFKFTISDPYKRAVLALELKVRRGRDRG